MNEPVRLVIAGTHPLLRWALWRVSEETADIAPVGEADDVPSALELTRALRPAVVIIDSSMSNGQGWRLARELRGRYDRIGIVIIAASDSDDLLLRALDAGASAFIAQTATIQEVLSAIRHAADSAESFSAAGYAQALRRRRDASDRLSLSPRERQVLALLRDGKSVPEVAATIYVSLSTAKTYVARLYEKLGASNRAQALMTAVDLGLFDQHSTLAI